MARNHFLKFGLPIMTLVLGGAAFMVNFTSIRYEFNQNKYLTREEVEQLGVKVKPKEEVSIDSQYKKLRGSSSQWENKRIPRPYDE